MAVIAAAPVRAWNGQLQRRAASAARTRGAPSPASRKAQERGHADGDRGGQRAPPEVLAQRRVVGLDGEVGGRQQRAQRQREQPDRDRERGEPGREEAARDDAVLHADAARDERADDRPEQHRRDRARHREHQPEPALWPDRRDMSRARKVNAEPRSTTPIRNSVSGTCSATEIAANAGGKPVNRMTTTRISQTWFASQIGPIAASTARRCAAAPRAASPADPRRRRRSPPRRTGSRGRARRRSRPRAAGQAPSPRPSVGAGRPGLRAASARQDLLREQVDHRHGEEDVDDREQPERRRLVGEGGDRVGRAHQPAHDPRLPPPLGDQPARPRGDEPERAQHDERQQPAPPVRQAAAGAGRPRRSRARPAPSRVPAPTITWNARAHRQHRRPVLARQRVQPGHGRVEVAERQERQAAGIGDARRATRRSRGRGCRRRAAPPGRPCGGAPPPRRASAAARPRGAWPSGPPTAAAGAR